MIPAVTSEPDIDYREHSTFLLFRLHRVLRHELVEAFAEHGFAFAEFAVMNAVRIAGPITNAELSRTLRVVPQSSFRLVTGLLDRGVLERAEAEGSNQPVVLSAYGAEQHDILLEIERDLLVRLSRGKDPWLARLNTMLSQGLRNLDADPAKGGRPL